MLSACCDVNQFGLQRC